MRNEQKILTIKEKYADLKVALNERSKRLWAATEARSYQGIMDIHENKLRDIYGRLLFVKY